MGSILATAQPVPMIIFHGTGDFVLPLQRGPILCVCP